MAAYYLSVSNIKDSIMQASIKKIILATDFSDTSKDAWLPCTTASTNL